MAAPEKIVLAEIPRILASLTLIAGCASAPSPAASTPGATASATPVAAAPKTTEEEDQALLPEYSQALLDVGIDPASIGCNGRQIWSDTVGPDALSGTQDILLAVAAHKGASLPAEGTESRKELEQEVEELFRWRLIRTILLGGNYNNLGAVQIKGLRTAEGKPVIVYRTGITPDPGGKGACFRSLIEQGGVRHAVNLYAGAIPTKDLDDAERATVEAAGGTYFLGRTVDPGSASWRTEMRKDPTKIGEAMAAVAKIVNEHVLRPAGALPQGNVVVHCGGGMHRTGMVVGVLQRCINGDPIELIERQYKRHTAWRSPQEPGGFEQANLDFVQSFDCSMLNEP